MKENKKKELHDEIISIGEILILAQESLKMIEYLIEPELDNKKLYAKRQMFFDFSYKIYWRITVIELCKLFSGRDTDSFNLVKLIGKLRKGNHFGDAKISETKLAQWQEEINLEKGSINNLLLQRDRLYAHKDRELNQVQNIVNINKTWALIKLGRRIIQDIYSDVFDISYMLEDIGYSPVDNLEFIINNLAERERFWDKIENEITNSTSN